MRADEKLALAAKALRDVPAATPDEVHATEARVLAELSTRQARPFFSPARLAAAAAALVLMGSTVLAARASHLELPPWLQKALGGVVAVAPRQQRAAPPAHAAPRAGSATDEGPSTSAAEAPPELAAPESSAPSAAIAEPLRGPPAESPAASEALAAAPLVPLTGASAPLAPPARSAPSTALAASPHSALPHDVPATGASAALAANARSVPATGNSEALAAPPQHVPATAASAALAGNARSVPATGSSEALAAPPQHVPATGASAALAGNARSVPATGASEALAAPPQHVPATGASGPLTAPAHSAPPSTSSAPLAPSTALPGAEAHAPSERVAASAPTTQDAHQNGAGEDPSATAEVPEPAPVARGHAEEVYVRGHHAHFVERNPAAALAAWDEYLRLAPEGRFGPEARFNRAIDLVRLGRTAAAIEALEALSHGDYRQDEAARLLDAVRRGAIQREAP